jgi:Glycosyltransferase family 87
MNAAAEPLSGVEAQSSSRVTPLRTLAAFCMLALGVGILCVAMSSKTAANTDFISYWAAGRQLVHRENPYDGAAISRLEDSAGAHFDPPLLMRNPPYAFFLVLPLGFVSAKAGSVIWSIAILAALMVSIRLLWMMHGRSASRLHLVAYCFPPIFVCMLTGQTGVFVLLGVVLFLHFHATRPFFSGAALLLCALKPHLFIPFGVVLVAWILTRKAYRILAGAAAALIGSCSLSFCFDPAAWSHYVHRASAENIQNQFIPTVSLLFRILVNVNAAWLQLVPGLAGCLWALWYFWKRRNQWDWTADGSLLLMVSILVAPYAWFTDQCVLFPAVLAGLYLAANSGRLMQLFACITGAAMLEVLFGVGVNSGFYFVWAAPAWLAWYVNVTQRSGPIPGGPCNNPTSARCADGT